MHDMFNLLCLMSMSYFRTVTDSTLWTILAIQKRKWLRKIFFLLTFFKVCFEHSSQNQMQTCHQTCTFHHTFLFMLFSYISILLLFIQKFKLSIKDYLLLIYTFMCMIIFLKIIILSFQNHQNRILKSDLGMAQKRYGLSCIWYTHLFVNMSANFSSFC